MALPRPITVTDEYLEAVLDALGEIRDRLPAPKAEPKAGPVQVAEPAHHAPAKKVAAKHAAPKRA